MKKLTIWTRVLSLLLCLVMLGSILVACGPSGDEQAETAGDTRPADSNATGGEETPGATQKPNDVEELPEVNYGGKEFKMLMRKSEFFVRDMYIPELTGKESTVDIAVYKRNKTVEAKYGVKLVAEQSTDGNMDTSQLTNISQSGTCDYHIIANHGRAMFVYAINGALRNWNKMEYIDTSKVYWNQGMVEDFTINGSLYCLAGDMSYQSLGATVAMIFNKDVCAQIGEEYPYEAVLNGEWTFEMFERMVKKSGDGTGEQLDPDSGALMGYMTTQFRGPLTVLYSGGGSTVTLNDDKTKLELSLYNSRNEQLFSDYFDLTDLPNCKIYGGYGTNIAKTFATGNILFFDTRLYDIKDIVNAGMEDYGVLPWPKYDKDVDGYYSWCDAVGNTFGIPKTFDTETNSFISVVLEALCAEGYREVLPVYYEDVLQAQYVDAAGVEMINLIRDGRRYDIATYMMSGAPDGGKYGIGNCGYYLISYADHNFTTWWEETEESAKSELARINTIFSTVTDLEDLLG